MEALDGESRTLREIELIVRTGPLEATVEDALASLIDFAYVARDGHRFRLTDKGKRALVHMRSA